MYVITVTFEIDAQHCEEFDNAMIEQARNSLALEEGCLFFDVCRDADRDNRWFLYEIYTSEAAFQDHLASDHFYRFDVLVAPWIIDKQVRSWARCNALPLTVKPAQTAA